MLVRIFTFSESVVKDFSQFFKTCVFIAVFANGWSSVVVLASDVRDASTEREWSSSQYYSLGTVGHMSEELTDQFFSDPSAPAQRQGSFELQWANLHVMYSKELMSTIQDARSLQSDSSSSKGTAQTVELLDKVRSLFGRNLGGALNLAIFSTRIKGVTVVPYLSAFVDGAADVPSWPRAKAEVDTFAGLGIGYGMQFAKDWGLGINVRPGVRGYAQIKAGVSDVGDFSSGSSTDQSTKTSELASYGSGFYIPVDIGGSYQLAKSTRFNLVIRDLASSAALSTIQGTKPPKYAMRISLGASSKFFEKGPHTLQAGTDLQDLMGWSQSNGLWYRWQWAAQYLYRLGTRKETSFGLKTGLRSGFPSVGVLLDLYLLKLEAAYFTREAGYYPGQRPVPSLSYRVWSQMTF
jgi:hypothetical protein